MVQWFDLVLKPTDKHYYKHLIYLNTCIGLHFKAQKASLHQGNKPRTNTQLQTITTC